MVQEANQTREALRNIAQEGRRLKEYVTAARAALDATNKEAGEAKAAAAVAWVKLASKFDFAFLGLVLIWVSF